MISLPIDQFLPQVVDSLRGASNLVLVAEPGAGKTTRVPPAIVVAKLLSAEHPNLVMLQPRRVAARAAAMRIAEERGWSVGKEVGYHVRFDRKIGRETRLRVLTEGILTRQLVDDPFLEGIGAVVLDEFHERSLHTDVCIALLREVQQTVRPDLKIIVMSATLDAEPVATFLGDAPIVRVPGRTFPVDISYRQSTGEELERRVARAVEDANDDGDVLVFLPGVAEIQWCAGALQGLARQQDRLVLPLHGTLSVDEQIRAIRPADRRKIVLATNIAETSLTIDGVTTVIDSGLARVASYDPDRGMDRLDLQRISQASAKQRAGRAGRTRPGKCIRLWSEKEQHQLDPFELPEIRRVDLASTVLSLHAWGKTDVRGFGWFEVPTEESLKSAEELLEMLGALNDGAITNIGRKILQMPVHPRLGRLMVAAQGKGLEREGAVMAALLSEKDILMRSTGPRSGGFDRGSGVHGNSDVLLRMQLVEKPNQNVDTQALSQVKRVRDELQRNVTSTPASPSQAREASQASWQHEEALLKLVLLAYPDRVCKRRANDPNTASIVGGGGVKVAAESCVRTGEFFVAVDARHDQRSAKAEALVRIASVVEEPWLEELFPQTVRQDRELVFDPSRQRVVARGRVLYRDLVLREEKDAPVDPKLAGKVLFDALAARAPDIFAEDECNAQLIARVALLRSAMPEHPWPKLDEAQLQELLGEACPGRRSVEELHRGALHDALMSRLAYPLDRLLEQHAPATIEVPTGNRIKVEYAAGKPPTMAVRLQELFGWTASPRIAGGRVPIVVHLLAPNYRPVQITNDLASFWRNTYFQVRKDLKARYPKHAWPDDPLSAKPEAKGSRRRN